MKAISSSLVAGSLCHRGFTLVEVMVALAVVAIALPALMFSQQQQIDGTAYLRDKSLARMVATNKLEEIRILAKAQQKLAKGKNSGVAIMSDRDWSWDIETTETVVPNMYRLEIKVSEHKDSQDSPTSSLFTLVSFLSADLQANNTPSAPNE